MKFVTEIDLTEPIIPGVGIGQIKILENAFTLRSFILSNTLSDQKSKWTFVTKSQFPDWLDLNYEDNLIITVNIYTGKIVSLTVKNRYKGKIFDVIGIGSFVKELIEVDNKFYYDELDECILHKEDLNIRLDLDLQDKLVFTQEEVLISRITEITILDYKQATTIVGAKEFPNDWIS